MIIAFTGHRPDEFGGHTETRARDAIKRALADQLLDLHPERCISGMALGVDQWAAEVCVELGIPFTAAIPFVGQESIWPAESQAHYRALLTKADLVHVVCEGGYEPVKMQHRNEWMVDNCDLLDAVWNGNPGGTANCVNYAYRVRRQVVNLYSLIFVPVVV